MPTTKLFIVFLYLLMYFFFMYVYMYVFLYLISWFILDTVIYLQAYVFSCNDQRVVIVFTPSWYRHRSIVT